MKNLITIIWILLFAVICGCRDAVIQPKEYTYLVTNEVTDISASGVTFSAKIIRGTVDDVIVDCGFKWGNGDDEFIFSFTDSKNMPDHFSVRITSDLAENKKYLCKAYVITKRHTIYGNPVLFTALGSESPVIHDFYPKSGFDNDIITMKGNFFSFNAKNNIVKIDNMQAEVLSSTNDSLTFRIPSSGFIGEASISLAIGSKKATATSKLNILGHEIESVSSNFGHSGNLLTINGKHFLKNGGLTVSFDTYSADIQSSSDNQIIVMIPIPTFSLMNDFSSSITVTSGKKTKTYKGLFTIKRSWIRKTPTPFDSFIYIYQAFTYNGKGYILNMNNKILYEYSLENDQWRSISNSLFVDERSYQSIYIVSKGKLYKIGGTTYMGELISDVWSYNFAENIWTKKNDIPFKFSESTFFSQDDCWYIITDNGQVWKCDLENEEYIRLNDFPIVFSYSTVSAFMADGKNYIATYGQTWLYDEATDNWIEKSSNHFSRGYATREMIGFSYQNTGYILDKGQNLYRYDYLNDKWNYVSIYPEIRGDNSYKSTFVIENDAYIAVTAGNYFGNYPHLFVYNDID